jgi:hypothetical protein
MSTPKALLAACLAMIALAACGSITKPSGGRGRVDDPRTSPAHLQCLLAHHLPAVLVGTDDIQVGPRPAGPTIQFVPTAAIALGYQIQDDEQGAEVIGNALLYPNQATDSELSVIEGCLDIGVAG